VTEEMEFRRRVQDISRLVQEVESIADPVSCDAAKNLMQVLMDLHAKGLERSLEIIFNSASTSSELIDQLGQDPLVGGLLVLYGLHPDDLPARIKRTIEQIQPRLRKMGAEVTLRAVEEGTVRLHFEMQGHACGSTKESLREIVEDALYEAAPDLTALEIEGVNEPTGGFVSISQISGGGLETSTLAARRTPMAGE